MITKPGHRLTLLLFLLCLPVIVLPQGQESRFVKVRSYVTFKFPADEIFFSVRLSFVDENATKVYNEHKALEKKFLNVIKEFGIPDSSVTYSLMEINKGRHTKKGKRLVSSNQVVNVKLANFRQYESFQVALISDGFDDFGAKFSSSKQALARKESLIKAIEQARTDATMIAQNLGKSLGDILEITT
ncbi:MAG: SIMPL domain-containing protein, partial [Nitrosomonadaceae bacterium]